MTNNKVQIKIKQRCNKIDSKDYDNLECWVIQEAVNKAQIQFCREQIIGYNSRREGDEQSVRLVDDLQQLLTPYPLEGENKALFFESKNIPNDYFQFKKVSIEGTNGVCTTEGFRVYLVEEANTDVLLGDENYKPSFDWRETFATLVGDKVRIYTNGDFKINSASLLYFRLPREIKFAGCVNLDTGTEYSTDQTSEFKDDVMEVIVDMAASIITGDLESIQTQRLAGNADKTK